MSARFPLARRLVAAKGQFRLLFQDAARIVNGRWRRLPAACFSPGFLAVFAYRFNRGMYLLLGPGWKVLRALLAPLSLLIRPFCAPSADIHYEADIGGGLLILHPALGVVISKYAIAGRNLTLTGGNCIGGRRPLRRGELVIGDDVFLGANAVVLGPLRIGGGAQVGAGAVALRDIGAGEVAIGVPATVRTARIVS